MKHSGGLLKIDEIMKLMRASDGMWHERHCTHFPWTCTFPIRLALIHGASIFLCLCLLRMASYPLHLYPLHQSVDGFLESRGGKNAKLAGKGEGKKAGQGSQARELGIFPSCCASLYSRGFSCFHFLGHKSVRLGHAFCLLSPLAKHGVRGGIFSHLLFTGEHFT